MIYRNLAVLSWAFILAGHAPAQTLENPEFRTPLMPIARDVKASGAVAVTLFLLRDDAGEITYSRSSTALSVSFPGEVTLKTVELRRPAAAADAPADAILIGPDSGVPLVLRTGATNGTLGNQPFDPALARQVMEAPDQFFVVVKTTDNPSGAIGGRLQLTESLVLMGWLDSANVDPPIPGFTASGIARVTATRMWNTDPGANLHQATAQAAYQFPAQTTVSSIQVFSEPPSLGGNIAFNFGASSPTAADGSGAIAGSTNLNIGSVSPAEGSTAPNVSQQFVDALFDVPEQFRARIIVPAVPGRIAMIAPLRNTEQMVLQTTLQPLVPGLEAITNARVTVSTLRDPDGALIGGYLFVTVRYGFPGRLELTGLDLRLANDEGSGPPALTIFQPASPLVIPSGVSQSQFSAVAASSAQLDAIDSLVTHPESYSLVLRTSQLPAGALAGRFPAAQ